MKKILFILLLSVKGFAQQPPIGVLFVGSEGWQYKRSITFDQPASDLTNYPVLVSGTYSYLATTANGGNVTNANGYDIAFFSDVNLTTMLDFEVELYTASTGQVIYWVKLPTLATASATVIYMAYGNAAIVSSLADADNTWNSNYLGVYHLKNGTTLNTDDATVNSYDATQAVTPTAVSGKIDGGMGGSYAYVPDNTPMTISSGGTLEMWFYKTATGAGTMIDKGSTTREYIGGMFSNNNIYFWLVDTTNNAYIGRIAPSSSYSLNTWHHVAYVYDGGTTDAACKIFIDGVQVDDTNIGTGTFTSVRNTANSVFIKNASGGLGAALVGSIDEVRISNVPYSADWLLTNFQSQNDPANFYVISSVL